MKLIISDVVISDLPYVKLEISKDFDIKPWDLIKSSLKQIQNSNFKDEGNFYIVTEWLLYYKYFQI